MTTEYIAYDPMGRVGRVRKSITGEARCKRKYAETAYEYDLSGKVAVIYYPEDDMGDKDDEENYDVEYLYYPGSGLIKAIIDSEDRTLAAFDNYPASGKIGHIAFHNQVKTDYVYSPFSLRLESITTMDRDNQPLMDRSYGYTLAGDIEDINDAVNAVNFSYTYDRLHRLVSENASAPVETTPMVIDFIYDDDAGPLHAAATIKVNGRIQEDIAYDANGNMTRGWNLAEPESVKPRNIAYNADNMPVSVTNGDAETRFIYDADGSRARKTSGAGSTYYFGDHFEYIKGTPTRYVFAGNLRIAKVTPCKIHYFHKDHLGSSTVISTASGKKADVESTAYLPYGGQRGADGISRSSYRFTDQEFDGETGLYNFDARLYDPVVGVFVSADSIVSGGGFDPQMLNLYTYVRNNPLIYVDPTGLYIEEMGPGNDMSSEDEDLRFHDPDTGVDFRANYDLLKSQTEAIRERDSTNRIYQQYIDYMGFIEAPIVEPYDIIEILFGYGVVKTIGGRWALRKAPKSTSIFPEMGSVGAAGNKLYNKLARLGNQASVSPGKQGSQMLQKMAKKAGLTIESGGKHLRVVDSSGKLITEIPHSLHGKGTAKSIAQKIMQAAGF